MPSGKHMKGISDGIPIHMKKDTITHSFRLRTPDLHANFTNHLRDNVDWHEVLECNDTQIAYDIFYIQIMATFDNFYPIKTITTRLPVETHPSSLPR